MRRCDVDSTTALDNADSCDSMSRSLTIIQALQYFSLLKSDLSKNKSLSTLPVTTLVLHIVGSNFKEGNSLSETLCVFKRLFDEIEHQQYYAQITLVLIGPNVHPPLHESTHMMQVGKHLTVSIHYDSTLWSTQLSTPPPDAIFCFNAGIWGYELWRPTLEWMFSRSSSSSMAKTYAYNGKYKVEDHKEHHDGGIPFFITTYTLFECKDDEEVTEEVVDAMVTASTMVIRELCPPERNLFRSRIERETRSAAPGRVY